MYASIATRAAAAGFVAGADCSASVTVNASARGSAGLGRRVGAQASTAAQALPASGRGGGRGPAQRGGQPVDDPPRMPLGSATVRPAAVRTRTPVSVFVPPFDA